MIYFFFFFFKQKTAYEMCGRDWSSDVCSSDLIECCNYLSLSFSKADKEHAVMVQWSDDKVAELDLRIIHAIVTLICHKLPHGSTTLSVLDLGSSQ